MMGHSCIVVKLRHIKAIDDTNAHSIRQHSIPDNPAAPSPAYTYSFSMWVNTVNTEFLLGSLGLGFINPSTVYKPESAS